MFVLCVSEENAIRSVNNEIILAIFDSEFLLERLGWVTGAVSFFFFF